MARRILYIFHGLFYQIAVSLLRFFFLIPIYLFIYFFFPSSAASLSFLQVDKVVLLFHTASPFAFGFQSQRYLFFLILNLRRQIALSVK